jgi:hypothetical protein
VTTAPHIPAIDPDTVDDSDAIAPMLDFIRAASGGRVLEMHRQMAVAPLVLEQYIALRRAIGAHAAMPERPRAAVAVAASAAGHGSYTLAINGMLARRVGWSPEQVQAVADGRSCGDANIDALLEVVREAVDSDGRVTDVTWSAALDAGWSAEDLAETYGYIALVGFCDRFVRYAGTDFDVAFAAAS